MTYGVQLARLFPSSAEYSAVSESEARRSLTFLVWKKLLLPPYVLGKKYGIITFKEKKQEL